MELRVLNYFLAVVREESISGAAKALHVTQPTLSRQIMDLEEELGVMLLTRGKRNRKVILTEEGLLFYKRAQEIVELAHKAQAELRTEEGVISGDIYIGGGETDAMRLIARTAKELQREYPHIRYHLFSGNADDVTERLDKGLLDLGVLIEPANVGKYDYIRMPAVDTWGLLVRADHLLANQKTAKPQDLLGLPLLTSRQTLVRNELSGWLGTAVEKLNIVGTYNLVYNASLMVDEGFGVALCLDKLVNTRETSNLRFLPLEPALQARLNVVWKKHQIFSKATELFLSRLRENFR